MELVYFNSIGGVQGQKVALVVFEAIVCVKRKQSIFKLVSNMCQFICEKEVIPSVSAFKSDVFRQGVFNYSFGGISLLQFCWWR